MTSIARGVLAATIAALAPVAHAAITLTQQNASVEATLYAGPNVVGLPSADGDHHDSTIARLTPGSLNAESLYASAQVDSELSLTGLARYASSVGPDGLSIYSEINFSQNKNVSTFSADMGAGVVLKAQGRMVFSVDQDTIVQLRGMQSLSSGTGFVPQSMKAQSSYALERIIGATDGIDQITGLPAVQTIAVSGADWMGGDTLLTAGNYLLRVDNIYYPGYWSYQTKTLDLSTGQFVVSTNPNPGFYGSLVGYSGVTLQGTVVPEPATWALMALGLAGLGLATRRRAHA